MTGYRLEIAVPLRRRGGLRAPILDVGHAIVAAETDYLFAYPLMIISGAIGRGTAIDKAERTEIRGVDHVRRRAARAIPVN